MSDPAAGLFFARMRLRFGRTGPLRRDVVALLRYSSAFAATASYSSLMLFALRWYYREHFGTAQLGYWLAANRISDMSTQLAGLFLVQFFVPHFTGLASETERRAFVWRCWAAGAAVMACAPLLFTLASRPLVHLFLSDSYLPAISAIRVYMVGDLFRLWTAMAMYSAFARGLPARYALTEIAAFTLMGVFTLLLTAPAGQWAPMLGYACAFAAMAVGITYRFLKR